MLSVAPLTNLEIVTGVNPVSFASQYWLLPRSFNNLATRSSITL